MQPARFATAEEAARHAGNGQRGIYLGEYLQNGRANLSLVYSGDRHGLLFGPTGTGKTTRCLIPNLLGPSLDHVSLVVTDPKGELAAVTARERLRKGHKVRILDPFGKLRDIVASHPGVYRELEDQGVVESAGFNPLDAINPTLASFYDDVAALGEALVQIDQRDPHWTSSAQALLVGLAMWARLQDPRDLTNVRQALTAPARPVVYADGSKGSQSGLAGIVDQATAFQTVAENRSKETGQPLPFSLDTIAGLLSRFTESTREIDSIRSTADTQTRWMLSKAMQVDLRRSQPIDFATLKRELTTVYIIMPAEYVRTHSAWLRLVIVSALRAFYTGKGHPVYFLLDEMPALGALAPLGDAFALMRGYNVRIFGVAQDLVQLKDLYKDRYETFLANAGMTQFLTPNDLVTSGWMSRRAGPTRVNVSSVGRQTRVFHDPDQESRSENWQQQEENLEGPHELMGMDGGHGRLWLSGLSHTVRFVARHYFDIPELKNRHQPNPYAPEAPSRR